MKKLIFTTGLIFFLLLTGKAFAQTPTLPQSKDREKIESLKERVATRVAEMRTKKAQALGGEIKEVGKNWLILATKSGEQKILVDEETKIFRLGRGGRQTLTLEDLAAGQRVTVVVLKDNLVDGQTAKFIFAKTLPKNINGVVTAVNSDEGMITVKTKRGEFIVDVEVTTKIFRWEKDKGLLKSGLSKILVGDRAHVLGEVKVKGENRLTAWRILVLPGKAKGITEVTPTVSPKVTATPTTSE